MPGWPPRRRSSRAWTTRSPRSRRRRARGSRPGERGGDVQVPPGTICGVAAEGGDGGRDAPRGGREGDRGGGEEDRRVETRLDPVRSRDGAPGERRGVPRREGDRGHPRGGPEEQADRPRGRLREGDRRVPPGGRGE